MMGHVAHRVETTGDVFAHRETGEEGVQGGRHPRPAGRRPGHLLGGGSTLTHTCFAENVGMGRLTAIKKPLGGWPPQA